MTRVSSSDGTHFENILAYFLDDRPEEQSLAMLSEYELELKERWETAHISMIEFRSTEDTVKRLVKLYGISKPTAYRDVQNTEKLFGSFKRYEAEAWRYISIERKHKLYQLALKDKNLELAFKIDCKIDEIIGLDKEDPMVNLEKIQSNDYEIKLSQKQQLLIKQLFKKGLQGQGSVDMNVGPTIDIDFTEINALDEQDEA